ncbi:MAG TPA: mechanosensitive ion channel family protein [Candidatus Polarisedimenticolia bacterium]|nr:mechanosensitive ion channel family protein [Candidatus Polarisedimenticolia bacterium]
MDISPSCTRPHARVRGLLVGVLLLVLCPASLRGADVRHPLEPPDLGSPRDTLRAFLDSMNQAWTLFAADDPSFREQLRIAFLCLDTTDVAPSIREAYSARAAISLKEVLDRLELPPIPDIPGPEEGIETLSRWVIPHTEIQLTRVPDGARAGEFIFSADTVERAGEFYLKIKHLPYQPGKTGAHAEELRFGARSSLLGRAVAALPSWAKAEVSNMQVWQWVGLLLAAALGLILFILAVSLGRRFSSRPAGARRSLGPFVTPVGLLLTTAILWQVLHQMFRISFGPAIAIGLALKVASFAVLAWLAVLVLGRLGALVARTAFGGTRPLTQQLVRVLFRVATILLVVGVAATMAQSLGFPITALVAGLGVGGLAVALAAQGTLENLIGGVILYADQPVRIGDFCRFGTEMGTVEEIGLRSVKIRTLGRTIVNVPNAQFARMQIERLSARDSILLRTTILLRYDTTRQQLEAVLERLEAMLRAHPRIAREPLRVRFVGFGQYAMEIELYALALTTDWADFLGLRQELLIRSMEIIEEAGTRLAVPTEIHYVAREGEARAQLSPPS